MKRTRKPGAGRKPVDPALKAVTRSFSMHPLPAGRLDAMHEGKPLGKWLVEKLQLDNDKV